jgi:hypothetical protein
MSLYEKFKDEAEFRDKFVRPLLNRLGFYGVSEQHGTQEFGKDFVFSELHRLGGLRHYAAQVKHEESIRQGTAVDELLTQVRQAFAKPFTRSDSPRECYVAAVYVFNSGEITSNAKDQLLAELGREKYGDNVHFLDGERLAALNEFATLQTDASARARLLGLRTALSYIGNVLREIHLKGQADLPPLFIHGIELYLSEPVTFDPELLRSLLKLWRLLQGIEALRQFSMPISVAKRKLFEGVSPKIVELAQDALPLCEEGVRSVDAALEKIKPLGGS